MKSRSFFGTLGLLSSVLLSGCAAKGRLTLNEASGAASNEVTVPRSGGDESTGLSRMSLNKEACATYDLTPEAKKLSIQALKDHLKAMGIAYKVQVERNDLHLFDLQFENEETQLRVATLPTAQEAGRHLHTALLEHGRGYWGVHRSNLAVLGPAAPPENATAFAVTTGLACWGVYTQAGLDDTFAVPGGYFEL